jgi:hypothetical protein
MAARTNRRVAVILPWRNLGCLGLRVGGFYADVFLRPYLGAFINTGRLKIGSKLAPRPRVLRGDRA